MTAVTDPQDQASQDPTLSNGGGQPMRVTDPELLAVLNSDLHPDDAGLLYAIRQRLHGAAGVGTNTAPQAGPSMLSTAQQYMRAVAGGGPQASQPLVGAAAPHPHETTQTAESWLKTAEPYLLAAENGATAGFGDRINAEFSSLTGIGGSKGDYAGNLKANQDYSEQFAREHPIGNAVAQTAGTLPWLFAFPEAKGLSLGARLLRGAAIGGGVGAAQGFSSVKDWGDNGWQDLKKTGLGALGGAAGGTVATGLGAVAGSTANEIANLARRTKGMSWSTAQRLLRAVEADGGPQAVRAQLAGLGSEGTMADTGPALLGAAQNAATNSAKARTMTRNVFTPRQQAAQARIDAAVDAALGPVQNPQAVSDPVLARLSKVDQRVFPAVLQNATADVAPVVTKLDAQIAQSTGPEATALQNLRGTLVKGRQPTRDITGRVDQYGNPRFDNGPIIEDDAAALHIAKRQLDRIINHDQAGLGLSAGALAEDQKGALKLLRDRLNDELEHQVPGYPQANADAAALEKSAAEAELAARTHNGIFSNTYQKVVQDAPDALRQAMAAGGAPPSSWGFRGLLEALMDPNPSKSYREAARIMSSSGPDAFAHLDALENTFNRRAALAPTLNRYGRIATTAGLIGAARYHNRAMPSPNPPQSD
jgi:hypothetical protein